MRVLIEINCDTISDLHQHLDAMKRQVRKECKSRKLDPLHDDFPLDIELEDDNCYGEHQLKIVPEPI